MARTRSRSRSSPAFDAVVTIYRGVPDHDQVAPLYGQMARDAEDHGYTAEGPDVTTWSGREDDELVIELALPVERVSA